VLQLLRKAADVVGVAIFATMFGAFLLQVFARYVLNRPLGWTEELSLVTYVWGLFWASAVMVPEREHVAFDLLYRALPAGGRRLCLALGALVIGGLFAAAGPAIVDYVRFMARERTWVLGIRFDLVFACFVLFVAAVVGRAAARLIRLAGPRWRDEV
jgi:TRAP-type C4-dicarboxylate transport system permease small subunit